MFGQECGVANEKQIAANQRHAGKSTGPHTADGKAVRGPHALNHRALCTTALCGKALSQHEDGFVFKALLIALGLSARARRDQALKPEITRVSGESFAVHSVRKVWR